MSRAPSCLPRSVKQRLLKVIDDMLPELNDKAVDETMDISDPEMPAWLREVVILHEQIESIPEC